MIAFEKSEVIHMTRKVILITGCSSGVGKAICKELDRSKYYIVATARKIGDLKEVPADLRLQLDVSKEDSIAQAMEKIKTEIGRIDILVNNAGFSIRSAMEEYDICQMKQMYDVNVLGCVRMIQAVLPYMRKQKCGKILNIGSISGRMTGIVNGGYCSTKYAVEAITEATRYEVADKGIQVSVIEPGAMETDFFKTLAKNSDAFMMNTNSPYSDLYQRDLAFRKKQKRAPVEVCAAQIVRIIEKPKLKVRYTIAVSWMYRLFTHMPDGLKEFIIKRVN